MRQPEERQLEAAQPVERRLWARQPEERQPEERQLAEAQLWERQPVRQPWERQLLHRVADTPAGLAGPVPGGETTPEEAPGVAALSAPKAARACPRPRRRSRAAVLSVPGVQTYGQPAAGTTATVERALIPVLAGSD